MHEISGSCEPKVLRVHNPSPHFFLSSLECMPSAGGNLVEAELKSGRIGHVDRDQPRINRLVVNTAAPARLGVVIGKDLTGHRVTRRCKGFLRNDEERAGVWRSRWLYNPSV